MKTENGYQLLRVGGATSGPVTQTIGTNSTNPTQIRLQTVPAAVSRFTGPPLALRKTIVRSSTSTSTTTTTTHHHHHQQQQQQQSQPQQQQVKKQHQQQATATLKQIKQNVIVLANDGSHYRSIHLLSLHPFLNIFSFHYDISFLFLI